MNMALSVRVSDEDMLKSIKELDKSLNIEERINKIEEICKNNQSLAKKCIRELITSCGMSGLSNLGNTCFMNSSLQVVSATPELVAYLLHEKSNIQKILEYRIIDNIYNNKEKNIEDVDEDGCIKFSSNDVEKKIVKSITWNLTILLKKLWRDNQEYRPLSFKKAVNRHLSSKQLDNGFEGYQQEDAQEFLIKLFEQIDKETKTESLIKVEFSENEANIYDKLNNIDEVLDATRNIRNELNKVLKEKYELKIVDSEVIDNIEIEYDLKQKYNYTTDIIKKYTLSYTNLYNENKEDFLMVNTYRQNKDKIEKSYSIINRLFSGIEIDKLVCKKCNNITIRTNNFESLSLSIPEEVEDKIQEYDMLNLLKTHCKEELLNESNKRYCEYCNKKTINSKQTMIYKNSNYLVILLKKWKKYNHQYIKTNVKIKYPEIFDMSEFNIASNNKNSKYQLYATIRHNGMSSGGHYISYTKNPITNLWYLYDDGDVYNVDTDEVLNSNSYILCYRM
jgi:ubiquitin C-terminal hydrolase